DGLGYWCTPVVTRRRKASTCSLGRHRRRASSRSGRARGRLTTFGVAATPAKSATSQVTSSFVCLLASAGGRTSGGGRLRRSLEASVYRGVRIANGVVFVHGRAPGTEFAVACPAK